MQLGDHRQDVLGRALERGSHRVHSKAHPILRLQAALDLGDVLAGAGPLSPEGENGQVRGRHPASIALRKSKGAMR